MNQTTITKEEEYQLIGLKLLAHTHNEALDAIKRAVQGITGEVEENGHSSDFTWDDTMDVPDLLKKLDIVVAPKGDTDDMVTLDL